MSDLRIVFMGTPQFAVRTLSALNEKYNVVAVITQPDRERDRKGNYLPCDVKCAAQKLSVPVYQFDKVKVQGIEILKNLNPDIIVTCAYGQILSQQILDIPRYGVLNVHASLLPYYRGSAPIQRVLINGEKITGVTIMKTDIGMDTGDILSKEEIEIDDNWYLEELSLALCEIGARLLPKTIEDYVSGNIVSVKQDNQSATYAPMLKNEDSLIDWARSAQEIRNRIRGVGEGIFKFNGSIFKIFKASLCDAGGIPGKVIECKAKSGFIVATGKGALKITEIQPAGKRRMTAADFINGRYIKVGDTVENG